MSVFNRLILIIIGIVLLVGAVITLLVANGLSTPDFLPGGLFKAQLQNIADASGSSLATIIRVSIIVAICGVALLVLEFITLGKPSPSVVQSSPEEDVIATNFKALRKQDLLVINSTEKGTTSIDVESLCDLAENVGITVQNVHRFDSKIGKNSDGLLISARAVAALGSDAIEVGAKLRSRVTEAIEQLTGLTVAKINIKVVYDSPKKQTEPLAVR
jgi:hypothetical protein